MTVFADFTFRAFDTFTGIEIRVWDALAVFADFTFRAFDTFAGVIWAWVGRAIRDALTVNALAVGAVAIAATLLADLFAALCAALGLFA